MKRIGISSDPVLRVDITEEHRDHLDEVANKRNISRAALCRKWLAAGERAEATVIPDFDDPESDNSSPQDPVEQLFREELPESPDEAISIDKMRERLKGKIEGKVVEFVSKRDYVAVDGGEMYADE